MSWKVYMVLCADRTIYTGVTVDLEKRLKAHNEGRGAKYTASRRPVQLCYEESAETRGDAQRREAFIKRLPAAEKRRIAGLGEHTA